MKTPVRESALIIKREWLDLIFAGRKSWELRGSRTKATGVVGLIESGSGTVVGSAVINGVIGPLDLEELKRNSKKAGMTRPDFDDGLPNENTYAWVITKS